VLVCISVICNYITKSPKHLDDYIYQETVMNTQISTKLAALAVALMMNRLLIGGVAYLFNSQVHGTSIVSLAHTTAATLKGTV
jgi:membrane-associated PAP2 superfamily phosphatase